MKKENKPVYLGSVLIGEKFVFRSVEIMGLEYSGHQAALRGPGTHNSRLYTEEQEQRRSAGPHRKRVPYAAGYG